MRRLLPLAAFLLASSAFAQEPAKEEPLPHPAFMEVLDQTVGDKAPDFKLQGSDGKMHSLADHKGQAVVLAWFPKAFTGGCTAQCCACHTGSAGDSQGDWAGEPDRRITKGIARLDHRLVCERYPDARVGG